MVEKPVLNNKGRVSGQRENRPVWNNAQRVIHQNKLTHPHPKRKFVPTTVLTKSGQVPVNDVKVNNVSTVGPKAVVSAAVGNGENAVKSSACWIWRPAGNVNDHSSKDSGSYILKRFDYDQGIFDSRYSRHMTGNKSFLTDYQEIDGGFVAFGGSPKGAVNTACYVQNRVLVTKPHNKTPYELLHGRPPSISFMRPFGCPVTILNTLDPLGIFDRRFNDGVLGSRPDWLFDIDLLTNSMNYEPITCWIKTNKNAEDAVADEAGKNTNEEQANEGERNGQEKEG
ncbi:hypothetical protein Tco_1448695 [Tanacetum coccineum]